MFETRSKGWASAIWKDRFTTVLFMREYDIICILNVNAQNVHFMGQASHVTTYVSIQTKLTRIVFGKKHISGHEGYWRPDQECEKLFYKL